MKQRKIKWITLVVALAVIMTFGACKKKVVAPPPQPPPPPPPVPTASLTASPNTIQKGESAMLQWQTQNATDVTIQGIGPVDPNGTKSVTPDESTTYTLIARGTGGTQSATARITVTQPPPPPPPAQPSLTDEQMFAQNVKDIFYDYDSFAIRPDAQATLQSNVQFLQQHPNFKITLEGHCDERGSTEYNLALGDNRANAAKQALIQAGIAADRIRTISFGKEKPFCTVSTEECWQQNRRAHFVFGQK